MIVTEQFRLVAGNDLQRYRPVLFTGRALAECDYPCCYALTPARITNRPSKSAKGEKWEKEASVSIEARMACADRFPAHARLRRNERPWLSRGCDLTSQAM